MAVLGDATLGTIARELVETVKRNTTIDWNYKESVQAKLRVYVKRVLRKYGYPPDKQDRAVKTVLEQASLLTFHWASQLSLAESIRSTPAPGCAAILPGLGAGPARR